MKNQKLTLKAFIISDDLTFAVSASAALLRVGRRERVNVQWVVKYWPANGLKEKTMAEKASEESLDPHLILIPGSYAHRFPQWLRNWLAQWASLRRFEKAALGVMRACGSNSSDAAYTGLTRFIYQHDLSFVGETHPGPIKRREVRVALSPEPEVPVELLQPSLTRSLQLDRSLMCATASRKRNSYHPPAIYE